MEANDLIVFGDEGVSSEVNMEGIQQINTPSHQANSHIF
jgi:hypothetical protein